MTPLAQVRCAIYLSLRTKPSSEGFFIGQSDNRSGCPIRVYP